MTRTEDEDYDAPTGLEHIDVTDLLTDKFRTAVHEALAIADPSQRVKAFNEVILAVRCYRGLLPNKHSNLPSKDVRGYLQRGLDLARDLEAWVTDLPPVVRDYVLSAVGREANKLEYIVAEQKWSDLKERFHALRERLADALKLVASGRGRPENFELNDLVWSLALVWDEYTNRPFGLTKKGVHTPYEFVRMVCRAADPRIAQADFDRQLGTALRLATRSLRRTRAERSNK